MFIRKTKSRNSTCFQIGEKRYGKFKLVQHIGCANNSPEIEALRLKSQAELTRILFENQISMFPEQKETSLKAKLLTWHITGFHEVFGTVYDRIGFTNTVLRDFVVARIVYPKSKFATIEYLNEYLGRQLSKDAGYRFLDTLDKKKLTEIALSFVSQKNTGISLIFYDVTTLHFETDNEDETRKKGYSKDHRGDMPQILVGLFVDAEGYPFDFDFFEGNTFEGHTFPISIERLIKKYEFKELTVVADAGMLSENNLAWLNSHHIAFIVGARLKNQKEETTEKIINHNYVLAAVWEIILNN